MKTLIHRTGQLIQEDHNIVRLKFSDSVSVEIEDVKDYLMFLENIFEGEKFYLIIDTLDKFPTADQDVRKYFGSHPDALKHRKADIILVNNLPVRLLARFYSKWDRKRDYLVKIFATNEKAMQWIAEHQNGNSNGNSMVG